MTTEEQKKIYRHFLMPKQYWDVRLSQLPDLEKHPYKEEIKDWIVNFRDRCNGKGLYLYGKYGRGKGACAALIMKAAAVNKVSSLWTVFKLIGNYDMSEQRNMFSNDTTMLEKMMQVDLLVVDEFQTDPRYHAHIKILDHIIRTRYYDNKSTIIASNISPDTLKDEDLTKSLASILSETSDAILVHGKDFREKKKNDK